MSSLSKVDIISERASELIEEGFPTVLAIDMAYKEIMRGEKDNETK